SIERSHAFCSRPQRRSSSIVAVLATVARGNVELDALRSTTSVSTPYEPSVTVLARPPGPAPTTTTSNSSRIIPSAFHRTRCSANDIILPHTVSDEGTIWPGHGSAL